MHWARFNPDFELGVEPVSAALRGVQPQMIAEVGVQIALPEPTVEERQGDIPEATALYTPHPNPFNPSVQLSYSLSAAASVQLKVYDVRGRLIRTLVSGQEAAGRHSTVWNGDDDQGRQVASGVYFARFEGAGVVQAHRMVLLK